jgi:hypothetical protein
MSVDQPARESALPNELVVGPQLRQERGSAMSEGQRLVDARAANAALTGRLSVVEAGLAAAREALGEAVEACDMWMRCAGMDGADQPTHDDFLQLKRWREALAALVPDAERTEQ